MNLIETPKSQYAQIAELLRQRIDDGTYAAGAALPGEPALAEELGVSRVTVNRAIGLLRSTGDVKVKRGAGTYVRSLRKIERDARRRYGARGRGTGAGEVEVRDLNLRSRTVYREIGRTTPPASVAEQLQLGKRTDTLVRRRVLYADDEPTQIADSYYPWTLVKASALLREETGPGGSYGRLADLGYGPVRFTEAVNVRLPDDAEQQTLELEPTQPVFEISHVAYAADDRPVEVAIHVMPGHLWTLLYGWNDEPSEGESGS